MEAQIGFVLNAAAEIVIQTVHVRFAIRRTRKITNFMRKDSQAVMNVNVQSAEKEMLNM